MDKRGELFKNLFLVSILIVMVIFGVYFATGVGITDSFDAGGTNFTTTNNNATSIPYASWIVFWSKGNESETYNFIINQTSGGNISTEGGINQINITFPSNVGLVGSDNATSFTIVSNITGTPNKVNWTTLLNITLAIGDIYIINASSEGYGLEPNQSMTISFNATFNDSSIRATEQNLTWRIDVYNRTGNSIGNGYSQINATYGGVDGLAPRLIALNVSDGYGNTVSMSEKNYNFNGTGYLRNGTNAVLNVTAVINDTTLNMTNVTLYANISVSTEPVGTYGNMSASLMTNYKNESISEKIFTGTINITLLNSRATGNGNHTIFSIVASDLFNQVSNLSNSDKLFNISLDGENPTASITMPSTTTIETSQSIKIECGVADSLSGVNSNLTEISITKPSGTVIKGTQGDLTYTFTNTDTNEAGKYTVNCEVTDNVGLTGGATSQSFSVQYAGGGGAPSAGPAGPSADIIITEPTGESDTKAKEGSIKTFTLDGTTIHKITFLEVTTSSVTLKIESDPVEITLNIGETKGVDIDGDGNIDIEVRLNSITEGVADISVKKVGLPAAEGVPEEVEEEVAPEEGIEEAPSRAGLVVAIIIIIIVVVAVIYFLTKKKKK